ncbi:GNAT family N-acetyltransferase [Chitinimonas sp.]|uniref:GNAT family N-acetyltransferase n=1 Tax=Chitinimonas sp. TaxID=1934313 RepID=UPI0035B0056E
MSFPVLRTPRLILREIVSADVDALFAIHADAEAMKWFGSEPMTERYQARQLVDMFASWRRDPNPGTRWGIAEREHNELLGSVGLFRWNRSWRNCVVGYELGRAAWGKGYMHEALQAALDYGFREMQLHRVQAEIHPDNHASIKLAERLGFKLEGRHRQQGFWLGQFHDLDCYGLLAPDWANKDKA